MCWNSQKPPAETSDPEAIVKGLVVTDGAK